MENYVNINDIRIYYEETGNPEGKPVLLMHGWGCTHATVKSIATILSPKMRVISVDLPGHGNSDEPPAFWGTYEFATLMEEFLREMKMERASLIGHSFGGRVAIVIANHLDTEKLVLVDSAGITPRRSLKYYYKIYKFKTYKKLAFILLGKERGCKAIERQIKKAGSSDYASSSVTMRQVMSRCVNQDLRKLFHTIKAPTLLIWGEEDKATPLSDAKLMEKLIPDAGLVSFAGCGHYSFLDNPFGFKTVLKEFFKV